MTKIKSVHVRLTNEDRYKLEQLATAYNTDISGFFRYAIAFFWEERPEVTVTISPQAKQSLN